MSSPKRRKHAAAAEVFAQQNVISPQDRIAVDNFSNVSEDDGNVAHFAQNVIEPSRQAPNPPKPGADNKT